MRLIDADKLKVVFSPVMSGMTEYSAEVVVLTIVGFPSVKAIPYEWIENYMNKFQINGVMGDEYMTLFNMLCAWEYGDDEN